MRPTLTLELRKGICRRNIEHCSGFLPTLLCREELPYQALYRRWPTRCKMEKLMKKIRDLEDHLGPQNFLSEWSFVDCTKKIEEQEQILSTIENALLRGPSVIWRLAMSGNLHRCLNWLNLLFFFRFSSFLFYFLDNRCVSLQCVHSISTSKRLQATKKSGGLLALLWLLV